jgi:hypothetical protein
MAGGSKPPRTPNKSGRTGRNKSSGYQKPTKPPKSENRPQGLPPKKGK